MDLQVEVKPRAKQEKLIWLSDNRLKIFLKEPAEKGKANQRLLKILSKLFKSVKIISGFKSHKKLIKVEEM